MMYEKNSWVDLNGNDILNLSSFLKLFQAFGISGLKCIYEIYG